MAWLWSHHNQVAAWCEQPEEVGGIAWREDAKQRIHCAITNRQALPSVRRDRRQSWVGRCRASGCGYGDVAGDPDRIWKRFEGRCEICAGSGSSIKNNSSPEVRNCCRNSRYHVCVQPREDTATRFDHRGGVSILWLWPSKQVEVTLTREVEAMSCWALCSLGIEVEDVTAMGADEQSLPLQPLSAHGGSLAGEVCMLLVDSSRTVRGMRYAIFLGGINVGGVKIRAFELNAALQAIGLSEIKTFAASGNVTCESALGAASLQRRVETALGKAFSYDAHVLILHQGDLAAVVAGYPFPTDDEHHRYVVICDGEQTASELGTVQAGDEENVSAMGRLVYWRCPKGASASTMFSKAAGAKRYKAVSTTRNLNTVEKML